MKLKEKVLRWGTIVMLMCTMLFISSAAFAWKTADNLETIPLSGESKFETAFDSSVLFSFEEMAAAFNGLYGNGYSKLTEEEKAEFSHIKFKIALGDYSAWSYCEELEEGKPVQRAVKVVKPDYTAAGLKVGETMDEVRLDKFDKDMQTMGWERAITRVLGKNMWLLNGPRGAGKDGPVKGFGFNVENDKIKNIFWTVYLID